MTCKSCYGVSMARGDCIVIGGGVIGRAIALTLQRGGGQICLIDPDRGQPASWGNAGHLAVEHVEPLAAPATLRTFPRRLFAVGGALDFVWRDVATWLPWSLEFVGHCTHRRYDRAVALFEALTAGAIPAWQRLLGAEFAAQIRCDGHLVVSHSRDASSGPVTQSRTGVASYRPLEEAASARLAALLTQVPKSAVRFAGTGQIADPDALLATLQQDFAAQGGQSMKASVRSIARHGSGWQVRLESGEVRAAETVVVAAGVWSAPLLRGAGLRAPLIAERGYHIGFAREDWPADLSPVVFEDRAVVMTRFRGGMRATSFVEFGRAASPPDPRKWARLEAHMRAVGALRDGPVTRWMGCRPTLPDYLPAIGGGEQPGLYYAIGHAHLGLTLAAITAELLADHLHGRRPAMDLAPLALTRFSRTKPGTNPQNREE